MAVIEWKMSDELLKKAYDACVDSLGKYNVKYIKKVLTEWHKIGVTTAKELEQVSKVSAEKPSKAKTKGKNSTHGSIDWSLMDQIINGE